MNRTSFSLFLLLCLLPVLAVAQDPCTYLGDDSRWDDRFRQPGARSGTVFAMENDAQGHLVVGGSAAIFGGDVSMYDKGVGIWDGEKWSALAKGLGANSQVRAIVRDAAGNLYLGGRFNGGTNNDGSFVVSRNVIRWNHSTQTWQALAQGTGTGDVYALALVGNTLYLGGKFSEVYTNGVATAVSNVASYDVVTGQWGTLGGGLSSQGPSLSGDVLAIEAGSSGQVFFGGAISQAGGSLAINSIARWTPGQGWDNVFGGLPSFQINASGQPTGVSSPSIVQSLCYDAVNDRLFAGGSFGEYIASASIAQRKGFAYLSGGAWTLVRGIGEPINFFSYSVYALALQPGTGKVYVGGSFYKTSTINPLNMAAGNSLARYDPATDTWEELDNGLLGPTTGMTVRAFGFFQGDLYAGGSITHVTPTYKAHNLVRWDGTAWDVLGEGVYDSGVIYALAARDSNIIAGGSFGNIAGKDMEVLGIWNPTDGWRPFAQGFFGNAASNFNKIVYTLFRDGNELYIGGFFGGVNQNITTTSLARYSLVTQTWSSWGSGLGGSFPRIYAFAKFKGAIYAAGTFTSVNGTSITHLARLSGSTWTGVGTFDNTVHSLLNVGDSVLVVGGVFTSIDGNANLKRVAAWDGTQWSALGRGINNGIVYGLGYDPARKRIYAGGNFTQAVQGSGTVLGVQAVAYFEGGLWQQIPAFTNGSLQLRSLRVGPDGTVYMGGSITQVAGLQPGHVLRWHPDYGLATFGRGLDFANNFSASPVESVALIDSFFYAVGSLTTAGDKQASRIARYRLDDPATQQFVVNLGPDATYCGAITLDAGPDATLYSWSTGETGRYLTVSSSGSYAVTAVNAAGCADSDTIDLIINPLVDIFAADSVSACDSVVLDVGAGYFSYFWNTGDTTQTISIDDNDLIRVVAVDAAGCEQIDSVFVSIEGYSPQATFTAYSSAGSTYFTPAQPDFIDTYFWDFGDGTTSTDPAPGHTYTSNDTFAVTLVATNTCGSDTSQQVVVIDYATSLRDALGVHSLSAYPNPGSGLLVLAIDAAVAGLLHYTLTDLQGRTLLHDTAALQAGTNQVQIDPGALAPGVYLLHLQTVRGSHTLRIGRR
ncbi:MAG: hypothetical protein OHK0039_40220 [Bacteroidia bacterium]